MSKATKKELKMIYDLKVTIEKITGFSTGNVSRVRVSKVQEQFLRECREKIQKDSSIKYPIDIYDNSIFINGVELRTMDDKSI